MILNGIEEIQKLLPSVNLRLDSDRLNDFMSRAQQWVSDEIIGSHLEETLEAAVAEGAEDQHARLRILVKRVIAAKAYLTFGDEMNLQLGEAGMVVQNNEAVSAASSQRRDNLMKSLADRLDYDCDALVTYLMNNSVSNGAYASWRSSEQFKELTMAFIPTLKAMRSASPTGKADALRWNEFLTRIAAMHLGLFGIASQYVSSAEIIRLMGLYRNGGLNTVQKEVVANLCCVAAGSLYDERGYAVKAAIRARDIMLGSLADFPDFANSDCATLPDVSFNAGHIVDTL